MEQSRLDRIDSSTVNSYPLHQNSKELHKKLYSIRELSELAGVSTRTLRYYDQIGLLVPIRNPESGYRVYRSSEVDLLQEILFYREFGMSLSDIQDILQQKEHNRTDALKKQLQNLITERHRLEQLITNLTKTIEESKGNIIMTDKEKFEGFKKELIQKNEEQYGAEIRKQYGDNRVDESNDKMMNLTKEEYEIMQQLDTELRNRLKEAVLSCADPASQVGKELIELHRKWLSYTWKTYSENAHLGLIDLYASDERFTAYYDEQVSGCTAFLKASAHYHLKHSI